MLTGDHGVREHPLYDSNESVSENMMFSSECVRRVFGNDNMFTTSGFIADLSSNSYISDDLKGTTLRIPADHDDLIGTLMDLLYEISGK